MIPLLLSASFWNARIASSMLGGWVAACSPSVSRDLKEKKSLLLFVALELPARKKTKNHLQNTQNEQPCKQKHLYKQHVVLQEDVVHCQNDASQTHHQKDCHLGWTLSLRYQSLTWFAPSPYFTLNRVNAAKMTKMMPSCADIDELYCRL